ncbi:AAA family ATPase [Bathymodiolus thermophilus thioautotrophic gill symbiont]|uniref:ATPase AAA-type core domain-containing protein n=1 Tax=Bathymodiolus thermophilus thioautotrophic gill symbiont TaxID=2360 RepID=A0A1J5TVM6_9GAMM|nr:AAA family ATPase [Bathymodiolus thermophilus thioautotrophic gill symbiont]OIR24883.1 hypothetical protein BGC33_12000 [Bathymodiolus thermophilus thioautotrophic gill symbiont]
MYLKNIGIKNIGPIEKLSVDLPFNGNNTPKPIIFVGENGAGKTILQSTIADALYEIGGKLFEDIQKSSQGGGYEYFKVLGGVNLKTGCNTGFSILKLQDENGKSIEYVDKIGVATEGDFKEFIKDFSILPSSENDNEKKVSEIEDRRDALQQEWLSGVHFYQPAYRYEEPFWKGKSFYNDILFNEEIRYNNKLGKEIEIISSTRDNKSFLLDLVLDFFVHNQMKSQSGEFINKMLWDGVNSILKKILKNEQCRLAIGARGGYRVSIMENLEDGNEKQILPSIDNLSLGESILLNLFINIIRNSENTAILTSEMRGIVAIDEIDVHLHSNLQNSVLPELISMFPKVQFIITTHSPLFVLGMKNKFGEDGFEIIDMPSGKVITSERFSEFDKAYSILKETERFEKEINKSIEKSRKSILFVEGDFDIRYIEKSAELLKKKDVLNHIEMYDANGFGGLDKIWKNYNSKLSEIVPQNILLLYDCDTNKSKGKKGKVVKHIIPTTDNTISIGIENLFTNETIKKAKKHKPAFIDITPEVEKTVRGKKISEPEKWEINKDEKGNLCDWICKNGTKEDFVNFESIFEIIDRELVNRGSQ